MERFSRAGLTFDVHDSGPRDGPVAVLLHGFPQFNDSWDAVAARLTAAGLRCVAPNQRGYSPGARPEGRRAYRMSELVEDIDALIDATGAGRVHLVAHDWGAAAAWQYAAAHPERLASFNPLAVPHGAAFLRALATSRQFFRSYYMYLFQLPAVPERLLVGGDGTQWRRLSTLLQTTHQSKERADRDAKAMADSGALHYAINWYRGIPLSDRRNIGTKVTVPTMFVWSEGDTAIDRKGALACGNYVDGPYRFERLGGSHWMLDEQPDVVADLLLEHVAAYPA